MQNRTAFNFLFAAHGGVCAIINTTCYSYVDQSGRMRKDLAEIWKGIQILHEVASRNNTLNFDHVFYTLTSWLPFAWIKEGFIIVVVIVGICVTDGGIAVCVNWCWGRVLLVSKKERK